MFAHTSATPISFYYPLGNSRFPSSEEYQGKTFKLKLKNIHLDASWCFTEYYYYGGLD